MAEHQKIKETLSVIRKALEDDSPDNRYNDEKNDDILILNQKINEDGTVITVDDKSLNIIDEFNNLSGNNLNKSRFILNKFFAAYAG